MIFSSRGKHPCLIVLQELYNQSLRVRSAVPHPRIMGIIRECGGKMHMNEGIVLTTAFYILFGFNSLGRKLEGSSK